MIKQFLKSVAFLPLIMPFISPLHASHETQDETTEVVDSSDRGQNEFDALRTRASSLWNQSSDTFVFKLGPNFDEQVSLWTWDAWKKTEDRAAAPREYTNELTKKELKDMRYLITTIAYKPLDDVVQERRALENALLRLDHIHPLRFVAACVEDLELRNAMHTIRKDKWLWKNFFQKVKKSLNYEYKVGNIRDSHVKAFASALDLDEEVVLDHMRFRAWDDLADLLYSKYPPIV